MDDAHFQVVVRQLQDLVGHYRREPSQYPDASELVGSPLPHLAWMLEQMLQDSMQNSPGKADRWLGFVQGSLWTAGFTTIAAERERNRSPRPPGS